MEFGSTEEVGLGIAYYCFPFCRPGWLTEESIQLLLLEGSSGNTCYS